MNYNIDKIVDKYVDNVNKYKYINLYFVVI